MPVLGVLACAGVQVKCLVARGASRTIYFIEIYERNDVEAHDDHPLEHDALRGFCASLVLTNVSERGSAWIRGSRRVGFVRAARAPPELALWGGLWRFSARRRYGNPGARHDPGATSR